MLNLINFSIYFGDFIQETYAVCRPYNLQVPFQLNQMQSLLGFLFTMLVVKCAKEQGGEGALWGEGGTCRGPIKSAGN